MRAPMLFLVGSSPAPGAEGGNPFKSMTKADRLKAPLALFGLAALLILLLIVTGAVTW